LQTQLLLGVFDFGRKRVVIGLIEAISCCIQLHVLKTVQTDARPLLRCLIGISSIVRIFGCFADEVACVDPDVCWETCQSHSGCSNIAYPKLVLGIMPKGK
jgi:hypothetical protein